MSLLDLAQTTQAIALANRLQPDELAIWHKICREYSKTFYTPLQEVLRLDPEHVMLEVYSEQLSTFEPEENPEDLIDMIGSLSDPEYDQKKERALREEIKQLEEEEAERLKEGRAVHHSLEKKDQKNTFENRQKSDKLPTSGGINMDLIKRLQENDNER